MRFGRTREASTMTTQSYRPVANNPLSGESRQFHTGYRNPRTVWEQAILVPSIDPVMGNYGIAPGGILSVGMKGSPRFVGDSQIVFVSFKNDKGSLFIDAYCSTWPFNTQHGKWSNFAKAVTPPPIVEESNVPDERDDTEHSAVVNFASGLNGLQPEPAVVNVAERIIQATQQQARDSKFLVTFDGTLSFDLTLTDGSHVLGKLSRAGNLQISVASEPGDERGGEEYRHLENPGSATELTTSPNTWALLARLEALQNKPKSQRWPAAVWPSDEAFADARQFIMKLPSCSVRLPSLGLADDGEVNFLWKQDGIHIDLGFYGDGTFSYYARGADEAGSYDDDIPVGQELPDVLSALISG